MISDDLTEVPFRFIKVIGTSILEVIATSSTGYDELTNMQMNSIKYMHIVAHRTHRVIGHPFVLN